MLYFAYGSNMDQDQMRERCPEHELLGLAVLNDYRLAFTIYSPKRKCGCADIVPSSGDTVYGLLYRLSDVDMARMDVFEGHPKHYCRLAVTVEMGGKQVEAETYEVVSKSEHVPPSEHYLSLLQDAASRYDFPQKYQDCLNLMR